MSRPLYPPFYVMVPIELLVARDENGQRLPAGALETWLDLRALAWGTGSTPRMDFRALQQLTGKTRSTLCGHLALLTHCFGLRWSISDNRLQVIFPGGEESGNAAAAADTAAPGAAEVGNAATPAAEAKPPPGESENLDSLNTQIHKNSQLQLKEGEARVQKSGLGAQKRDSRWSDPRTHHPAIVACRVVASRFPDLTLYDRLIAALGETPNLRRLWDCRLEWLERGYNPASWKWAVEWYVTGIPAQGPKQGEHKYVSGNASGGDREAEAAPSALAQRLSGKG